LLDHLRRLDWPGNVRQLRNCLERMTVLARGEVLGPADLPADLDAPGEGAPVGRLEVLKRSAILAALDQADGNRTRAAAALGISVRTLQRKLRDWGMAGPPGE
jgi:DNA-binding NtrC family response regulator